MTKIDKTNENCYVSSIRGSKRMQIEPTNYSGSYMTLEILDEPCWLSDSSGFTLLMILLLFTIFHIPIRVIMSHLYQKCFEKNKTNKKCFFKCIFCIFGKGYEPGNWYEN
jgi:hypothetical protein